MNELISVILPVYNGEKYLEESIESILNQTYTTFEFIIINDGSRDNSLAIIQKYAQQDSRIVVISRENKGLISTLNEGIKKAKGKYIARMDQDDISLPKRFQKQVELLKKDNIDICGCHFFIVNSQGRYKTARVISTDIMFNKIILSRSVPFAHGSVMFRKDFLIQNNLEYGQTKFLHAEDYALWIAMTKKNAKISNVDDFLFKYRDNEGTMSKQNINFVHGLALSKEYINENYKDLMKIIRQYKDRVNILNDFEKDQLSYFLIKTLFSGEFFFKLRYIRTLPNSINIINTIRVVFGR